MVDLMPQNETGHIEGLEIYPLRVIPDKRGAVLHMLRNDAPPFTAFGEVYFSVVNPGFIKAWKRHRRMTQHFAVPSGVIRLAVYDDRETSMTRGQLVQLKLGRPDHYYLVRIPARLWYGFQAISPEAAILANCADMPHDPNETESREYDDPDLPAVWETPIRLNP